MTGLIKNLTSIVNNIHDLLMKLLTTLGFNFTDKQLHFILIGIIGIILFFITDLVFKKLVKYSVSIISFIYTFTVLIVLVFGIEIEQKITGRGKMEFEDIVAGVWGFAFFFFVYVLIRLIAYVIKNLVEYFKEKNSQI